MKTFKSLNKKELLHLMESGVCDIDGFIRTRTRQKIMEQESFEKFGSKTTACWDCRLIAKKLGLEA